MKTLSIILILICSLPLGAQNKNHVYGEVFGTTGIYSLNYERNIDSNFAIRIGYARSKGRFLFEFDKVSYPLMLSYCTHSKKRQWKEFGIGIVYVKNRISSSSNVDVAAVLGYRHIFSNNLTIRIVFSPIYDPKKKILLPKLGFSFGGMF